MSKVSTNQSSILSGTIKAGADTIQKKGGLRDITGRIVETIQETADTWTLHIEVAPEHKQYVAGQFLSIAPHQFPEISAMVAYFEHIKGKKEPIRAYSMASAPHEPYVSITIKPEHYDPQTSEFPPILSPLLASSALKGRAITFRGYTGAYVLADDHSTETQEVLHLVSGSGIVPNFSIIKSAMLSKQNTDVVHTMIYVNKHFEDIIFRKELELLAQEYPQRFKLIHMLTREEKPELHGAHYLKGRPNLELLKKHVKDPTKVLVFACGAALTKWQKAKAKEQGIEPAPRFMESISDLVTQLGVDKKRFKHEFYG